MRRNLGLLPEHAPKVSDVGWILGESLNRLVLSALDREAVPALRVELRDFFRRQLSRRRYRPRHRDYPVSRVVGHQAKDTSRRVDDYVARGPRYFVAATTPAQISRTASGFAGW